MDLSARLAELDPANAATYQQRLADFTTRWQAAIKRWEAKAAPLKGRKIIVHHVSWVYLNQWLGLEQIGALEPKPGVPPTSAHLASLISTAKDAARLRHHQRRVPGPEAGAVAVGAHRCAGGGVAVHGGRRCAGEGPVRPVRLDHRQIAGCRQMTLEGLDISILGPAMVAGVIVLSTHVPLGRQVLARGIIFIDLAIAQIAAMGVIAGAVHGRGRTRHRRADRRGRRRAGRCRRCWPGPTGAGRRCRSRSSARCSCWRRPAACCCWPTIRRAAST